MHYVCNIYTYVYVGVKVREMTHCILNTCLICLLPITGNMYSLKIRLSGGANANEGKVEIYFNNTWGTVCDNGWDINDANVVCRMLGYSHALAARSSSYYGEGSGPIWLDNVDCTGLESSIGECSHSGWGVHSSTCNHGNDAAAVCLSK